LLLLLFNFFYNLVLHLLIGFHGLFFFFFLFFLPLRRELFDTVPLRFQHHLNRLTCLWINENLTPKPYPITTFLLPKQIELLAFACSSASSPSANFLGLPHRNILAPCSSDSSTTPYSSICTVEGPAACFLLPRCSGLYSTSSSISVRGETYYYGNSAYNSP
jgi:hypothetical protein